MTASVPEVVTVDGEEFYQWKVVLRVPKNWTPESGVFIAVAPPGGIANFPAAIQGEPGFAPAFRYVTIVELEPDDETEASAAWTLVTAGTETTAPVYDLELTLHKGAPGEEGGSNILEADDLTGTPTAEYILRVNAEGDGVEIVAARIGLMYWPTSVTVLSNATGNNAVCSVSVPAQPFPWRAAVEGQLALAPDGADVQVDLVARLGATDGVVVARGLGLAGGADQILALAPSPPVNSASGFGEVAAGESKVIYIRAEQQGSGLDTFDTVSGRALFSVRVEPIG